MADLLALPEDERFHEIIDGELIRKAMPSGKHGKAQGAVNGVLWRPFNRRSGGRHPGGWWLLPEVEILLGDEAYRPDLAGWRRERMPEVPDEFPISLRPDWVCEVLSPNNSRNDCVRKLRTYHRSEVGHYWIVDPQEEIRARIHPRLLGPASRRASSPSKPRGAGPGPARGARSGAG